MRTLAVLLTAAMLTACSSGSAESPRQSAAAQGGAGAAQEVSRSTPVTRAGSASTTCERPRAFVQTDGQTVFIPWSWDQRPRVRVHVGEVIHLVATGNCAKLVDASPQNGRLKVLWHPAGGAGPRYFKAIQPGRVRLQVSMPVCATPPNSTMPRCRGGVQMMGTALVTVHPSGD